MLQISTINEQDELNIWPVWFSYDKNKEKVMIIPLKNQENSKS